MAEEEVSKSLIECRCPKPLLGYNPDCPLHGTTVRTAPDFIIDGKPYEGELLFPDLEHFRGA